MDNAILTKVQAELVLDILFDAMLNMKADDNSSDATGIIFELEQAIECLNEHFVEEGYTD